MIVAISPNQQQTLIDTSVDSNTLQDFYPRETWPDGTVFRWIAQPFEQVIDRTRFQYAFVSLSGMAPIDTITYTLNLDLAKPQHISMHSTDVGFRTYRFLFMPTHPIINIDNDLRFSLTTVEKELPVIENRRLLLAISAVEINTIANNIPSLLLESIKLVIFILLITLILNWQRHQWLYSLLLTSGLVFFIFAHHTFLGYPWQYIFGCVSILIALYYSRYWNALSIWIHTAHTKIGLLIQPPILLYIIIASVLAIIYTNITTQYIVAIWNWSPAETPIILYVVQFISVPIIVFIAYGIIQLRTLPHIFIVVFAIHVLIRASIYVMYTPGCMINDSFYNASIVKQGWFEDGYSRMLYVLLYAFVQIVPLDWHAPLLFMQLLWIIAFMLIHLNLYQLKVPIWAHAIVFALYFFPTFFVASLNITRDGYFTVFTIITFLFGFWLLQTRQFLTPQLLVVGVLISIITGLRSDVLPVTILITLTIIYMIWRTNHSHQQRFTKVSTMMLPIIMVFFYISFIPMLMKPVTFDELKKTTERGNAYIIISNYLYTILSIETSVSWFVNIAPEVIPDDTMQLINQMYPNNVLQTNFYPFSPNLIRTHGQYASLSDATNAQYIRHMALLFINNPLIYLDAKYHMSRAMQFNLMWTNCSPRELDKNGYPRLELPSYVQTIRTAIFSHYIHPTLVPISAWHILTDQPSTIKYSQYKIDSTKGNPVRIFQRMPYGHWWNVDYYFAVCFIVMLTLRTTPVSSLFAAFTLIRGVTMLLLSPIATPGYQFLLYVMTPIIAILWLIEIHRWYVHRRPKSS